MELAIAEHCSIFACDHIGEIFRLHNRQYPEMRNGVLAPYRLKKLVTDVLELRFTLFLDRSTDTGVSKYLSVVLRYFNNT